MFDASYASAGAEGAGSGAAYAVVGQYGNACTSGHENDAVQYTYQHEKKNTPPIYI